jgi:mono/diheme cytochrome c family protein
MKVEQLMQRVHTCHASDWLATAAVGRTLLLIAAIGLGALLAGRAGAGDADPGRAAYRRYCSACHGSEGKGDGVVASALRPKPTDLTQIAKQHGGKFPTLHVREVIDGRKAVAAHGESDMPVWGVVFGEQKAAAQSDAHVRGQVQLITSYLASIQEH